MPLLSAISNFSLLRGIYSPRAIVQKAKSLGYKHVAITDRENLYGLPQFLEACKEFGLTPLLGALVYHNEHEVLLYASGDEGFENLCRVITDRHCKRSFDLLSSLRSDSRGLIAASSSISVIKMVGSFMQGYYRMERPLRPPPEVRSGSIACLIAPKMVFVESDDYELHRLTRAIDTNCALSNVNESEIYPRDVHFKSWEELCSIYAPFPYAIDSTEQFASNLQSRTSFGTPLMPSIDHGNRSSLDVLREEAYRGAQNRYGTVNDIVVRRLDYELSLIGSKHFEDYFLLVKEIVMQSPRTCGRGSGAASIVAYSLGITNVDPIRYNLMFERFLNPGRTDPPDIDIDFAWDERDSVLDYVFKKYGTESAAMVATHQTCGVKMAIRETARVYGCTEDEISFVTRKLPWYLHNMTDSDLPPDPEAILKNWPATSSLTLDSPWPSILAKASRIIGMPRGIGTHCGGVIITPGPINRSAPIQYSAKGYPIVQWEKDGAEAMGLVKIDLLGNRSLAVIRDAILNVKKYDSCFDETKLDPQTDPATIDLLARGATMGVFYVESPAMRLLQQKSKRGDFEHLVIHSSIIRPAANAYIRQYLCRLHGEPYEHLHPLLAEVLSETYGIMVYQEDVSKVAISLAGFSFADADMLRKIMSKKAKGKRFDEFKKKFFEGVQERGVREDVAVKIWQMMLSFCGYSFCKPHSASYVQVSFQSAYLKAHYPAAFLAAVLSNYGGYYTTQAYIGDARRLGVTIIAPDVNQSYDRYVASGNAIIVGLIQIKGLSEDARNAVISKRNSDGNYSDINDLLERTELTECDAERLITAGACDSLHADSNSRPSLFFSMRCWFQSKRNANVLFLTQEPSVLFEPMDHGQCLRDQYRSIGFLTSCHQIKLLHKRYSKKLVSIDEVLCSVGKQVTFMGWCITSKLVSTKLGDNMEFVTFEDEHAICETVLFPNVYRKAASILAIHEGFIVSGFVTSEFDVPIVEVSSIVRP